MTASSRIAEAKDILTQLEFSKIPDVAALCLLALVGVTPDVSWSEAKSNPIGIRPIVNFVLDNYGSNYTSDREAYRRKAVHHFIEAGLVVRNPDDPNRSINSDRNVYQIDSQALELLRLYGTNEWAQNLTGYLAARPGLATRYAAERKKRLVPLRVNPSRSIDLSPGKHSELIKAIVEEFGPHFVAGGQLIYVGDTGEKWGYFDQEKLNELGVTLDAHGKMPDVVIFEQKKNWLVLVEAVTSHGPVDGKRRDELKRLFSNGTGGLVFVTAFPDHKTMKRYLSVIAWETEVWVADNPSHLIHFDGERFLGPYQQD